MKNGIPAAGDRIIPERPAQEVLHQTEQAEAKTLRRVSPERGKGVKNSRRPATVIGTKAERKPLSARMGRPGE
jgi:hypothetical protein